MSRWFRHYAGLCRDDKLVRVAIRSKQPIERVVWVWAAILESASEVNDGGRYDFDAGEASYFLRADECDVRAVVDALEDLGRICKGLVVHWCDRQFHSDTSAERQKRYRDRKKSGVGDNCDGAITSPSRHRDAPETETETETDIRDANASLVSADAPTPAAPVDLKIERDRKRQAAEREQLRKLGEGWNELAAALNLSQIEEIPSGSPRERAALARLGEGKDFAVIFAKIRGSPLLRGDASNWRATFDWIIKPANCLKILEGNYDESGKEAHVKQWRR